MSNTTPDPSRPDWVPENAGADFTTRVMGGVDGGHDGMSAHAASAPNPHDASVKLTPPPEITPQPFRRRRLGVDEYVQGILAGDRTVLARAITVIESSAAADSALSQEILRQILPHTGKSTRVGITGVPGVGKSTFIESFGCYLCGQGHKVAVLAVDPSSSLTRGSILGDKTRMEKLSRLPEAFIRPSPSGGTLGGVTRKSRETMLVCEAAGFDVLLIETVGVGQSETTVRSMVDFFLLLLITGAGDELQGIKKGIIELADTLLVTKADGDNIARAEAFCGEMERVIHHLASPTHGWKPRAMRCSALSGEGIPEAWTVIETFRSLTTAHGSFEQRRRNQTLEWVHAMAHDALQEAFHQHPQVKQLLPEIERQVLAGEIPAASAAQQLLGKFTYPLI